MHNISVRAAVGMTVNAEIRRARVLKSYGDHGWAVLEDDTLAPSRAGFEPIRIRFRRSVGRGLAGDRVLLGADDEVTEILPRRNCFGRGDNKGQYQPIAANLDTLLIVIAPEPAPSVDLLHRYVAAARIQDIQPVIIINKTDLLMPEQPPFDQLEALNLPIYRVRCIPTIDLDGLESLLNQGIHLLAGQSGVGKSSITNALLPDLQLQTQALSDTTGKGRHTTTSAELHALPDGGWLVDTPGVWEYGLWSMPVKQLALGFPEFDSFSDACRFRDCRHQHEPGCAVIAAVDDGLIAESRYRAWLSLLAEQERLSR